PTRGRSIYDEFIEKHGSGFHHIAFAVKDMDEALRLLAERGVEISQDGAWGKTRVEGRFAYLDTDPHGGLSVELLWDAP
ncbi:MAG: VOC family protein, partial [Candidatus Glassbacteria bacterium]